jgi:hypothetical protein
MAKRLRLKVRGDQLIDLELSSVGEKWKIALGKLRCIGVVSCKCVTEQMVFLEKANVVK